MGPQSRCCCSATKLCPTLCDPHGLQHARFPCPSPSPRDCSNSCPLSQWYHPTISSSVIPFSSCLQSLPASGFFPVSRLFASGGQSIGVWKHQSSLEELMLKLKAQYFGHLWELTHWKRPWCWERLKARGEGDDRGWDVWMPSVTQWTWVWAISGSWWWTGKPGVLKSMELQRVGHD